MASVDNYDPYEWKDAPGYKTTPTSATNFNHMETGIKKNNTAIKALCNEVATKAENTQTFSQAGSRVNINSGETISTVFGKIKKWFADLKTVAFSGSYNDLSNRPNLATVATSGSYNDLANKPVLPLYGKATLTYESSSSLSGTVNIPADYTDPIVLVTEMNHISASGVTYRLNANKLSNQNKIVIAAIATSGSFSSASTMYVFYSVMKN